MREVFGETLSGRIGPWTCVDRGTGANARRGPGVDDVTVRSSAYTRRPPGLAGHLAHSGRLGVPAGPGVVEGGAIPYQPAALAKKKDNFEKRETLDPESQCWLPGVPRITYMPGPFQIVQQAERVTILYEYRSAIRYVYMNGNPHPKGPIDWWMGDSRGRWEGNTLVVDVVHFNEDTWFDRAGNFHSDALHVVERYTPTSPFHMLYEATIEDPKVFTRPWKISMPLYRRQEKDIELLDYACPGYLLEREWENPTSTYFR